MKRHNKTYKKRMTKRQWEIKSQIILILAVMLGAAVIGNAGEKQAFKIALDEVKHEKRVISQVLPKNTPKPQILSVEEQILKIAKDRSFKWPSYLTRLAFCESSLNPKAIGDNGKSRGLFQIHKGYHPEVSDSQAFDIDFSTNWAIDMINKGEQHQWTCNSIILARK